MTGRGEGRAPPTWGLFLPSSPPVRHLKWFKLHVWMDGGGQSCSTHADQMMGGGRAGGIRPDIHNVIWTFVFGVFVILTLAFSISIFHSDLLLCVLLVGGSQLLLCLSSWFHRAVLAAR